MKHQMEELPSPEENQRSFPGMWRQWQGNSMKMAFIRQFIPVDILIRPYSNQSCFPHLDLIYFDLKFIDPKQHKAWTGVTNETILSNFMDIVRAAGSRVVPRIPLVPGITATEENLSNLACFLRDSHVANCELLPYNSGGMLKRVFLGKPLPEVLMEARIKTIVEERYKKFFVTDMKRSLGGVYGY